jgi:uncharacterized protein YdaU (DUF1376 family)
MFPEHFECAETVRRMDFEAIGFYLTLLNFAWTSDGLPPDFVQTSGRLLKEDPRKFRRLWKKIEANFPMAADGRFRNPRQEVERTRAFSRSKKAVKAADARWKTDANASAQAMPAQNSSNAGEHCHTYTYTEAQGVSVQSSVVSKNTVSAAAPLLRAREAAAAAAANGAVSASNYPLTAAAIRESFPATKEPFIAALVSAAFAAAAEVTNPMLTFSDQLCADAVRQCAHQRQLDQRGVGLFMLTVPEFIDTAMRCGFDAAIPKKPPRRKDWQDQRDEDFLRWMEEQAEERKAKGLPPAGPTG